MAIEDLNNKTDGILDDILPHSRLRYVVRSPRLSFSYGALGAVDMIAKDRAIKACIGPVISIAIQGKIMDSLSKRFYSRL